jgi:hypothetical protein
MNLPVKLDEADNGLSPAALSPIARPRKHREAAGVVETRRQMRLHGDHGEDHDSVPQLPKAGLDRCGHGFNRL